MFDWVPKLRLINQTIHNVHIWPLCLEGAEHPVPDDEEAGVVLVEAVPVGPVVDSVVAGSVQYQLQRPQVGHWVRLRNTVVCMICMISYEKHSGRIIPTIIHTD